MSSVPPEHAVSSDREGATRPLPEREAVARPAGLVSLATMMSRITGLLREAVFAALFATSALADAFVFAFRIPNLLRDFFAEGALSSAFVPAFTQVKAEQGDKRAFELARRVFGTLGVVTGLLVILGILFAPVVVSFVAMDAPADLRPLTVEMTRIMFPFLMLVAFASVAMGILNTHRRYFVPALAPLFFNVAAVGGGLVLLALDLPSDDALLVWSGLVLLGGALQFLIQVPLLRRVGLRGRPLLDLRLRDPAFRQIVRRMGPVVIGLAGTNVMLVITTILASRGDGWASSLNYAFRLVHLPIGVVGVAVGTVVLSAGARRLAGKDPEGFDDVVRRGLRLNGFLSVPAAVGLFLLAEPLVSLIFERGRFDAASSRDTADVLRMYALGVAFYAGVKAAAPAFIARGDTRTPMICSLTGIAVNLVVSLALIDSLGARALALAVAAGAAVNYVLLRVWAWRRFGSGSSVRPAFLLRVGIASLVLAGGCFLLERLVLGRDGPVADGTLRGVATLAGVAVLGVSYLLVSAALGVDEVRALRRRFRRSA